MNGKRDFWPVIFLTLVMIGSVGLLTLTDAITRDKIAQAKQEAIEKAIAAGANPDTVQVVDVEEVPLAYLPSNAIRIHVKAVGDLTVE